MAVIDLDTIISELKEIPPSAQILSKLIVILRDPESEIQDVVKLLKVDVSLSTSILRYSGSSLFGSIAPATGLEEAIHRIGFKETYRLVSIAASKGLLNRELSSYNAQQGEMLLESLATAQIMHALGQKTNASLSDCFYTTGLLYCIGKIAIDQYLTARGISFFSGSSLREAEDQSIWLARERKILGFDHAEVGAALLDKWGFAPQMTEAIRVQYIPEKSQHHPQLTHCLNLAGSFGVLFRKSENKEERPECPFAIDQYQAIGLSKENIEKCLDAAFVDYLAVSKIVRS